MPDTVGQIEKKTQQRVVTPFREQLGYRHLGDWTDRGGNRNIEPDLLRAWLVKQGVADALINRVPWGMRRGITDTPDAAAA